MHQNLRVNEIYLSLQGESTFAGLLCVFIRLTACNLRCSYCDTAYAFNQGRPMPVDEVLAEVTRLASSTTPPDKPDSDSPTRLAQPHEPFSLPLIELTGGEPLLQPAVLPLMSQLCDRGHTVLIETSGALDIGGIDPRVHRIMDLKCPSSGEADRNRWDNIALLRPTDEVKFVIATIEDYEWAKRILAEHQLARRCPVLFSWAAPLSPGQQDPSLKPFPHHHRPINRTALAERIIADKLPARFQLQMHKIIWPPDQRGV